MLAPHEKELLAAHIDGELTAQQRRQVEQLLRQSGEARAFADRLRDDTNALRSLPRLSAPPDLADNILVAIAQQRLKPGAKPRVVKPPRRYAIPSWVGYAAAAAVLLIVGVGSFLLHRQGSGHDRGGPNVATGPVDPEHQGQPVKPYDKKGDSSLAKKTHTPPQPPNHGSEDDDPPEGPDKPEKVTPGKTRTPNRSSPSVLATPDQHEGNLAFERVTLSLPVVLRLHDLDKPDHSAPLSEHLGKSAAHRIELPARDATRGFDRLRAVLTSAKIDLLIDPAAQRRLKMPTWRGASYAVFVENLTPAQAVELLRAVGVADRTAGAKKSTDLHFEGSLVLKAISADPRRSAADRKELTDLLGIDPLLVRPTPPRKVKIDASRPLSETTREHVNAALEGKGVARPNAGADSAAYVTLLGTTRSRPAELKRFLDRRQAERLGTVQLFIVLRHIQ